MTAMIAYVRCSTTEQATDGHSIQTQQHQILKACEHRDWTLQHIYIDQGISGKTLQRPQLLEALTEIAEHRAQGLIVSKLDRLSRSVIDFGTLLEWFEHAQARLVALDMEIDTSTPGGRLVAQVFAAVAQWELETIGQRTRDGLAAARAAGVPGRGSTADDPELADKIRSLRSAGFSLREICGRLEDDCVPTVRGGSCWRPSAIEGVLGSVRRRPVRRRVQLPEVKR